MARREKLINDLRGVLTSSMDTSTTTVSLVSGTDFPAEGDYRIVIDNEIMLVTAKSVNDLTVVRAYEGTVATTHASATAVLQIVTEAGLKRIIKESSDPWAESTRPPLRCMDDNGDLLDHTDFTTVGLFTGGTLSSVGDGGPITIVQTSQVSEFLAMAVRTAPTPPYEIIMKLEFMYTGTTATAGPILGAAFRESATSKLLVYRYRPCDTISQTHRIDSYTNETTLNTAASSYFERPNYGPTMWLKLADNNTNLTFYDSADGVNWIQLYTETRGANFTTAPNQVGFYVDNFSSAVSASISLLSWTGE